ncbi:aldehyde dehydrogenase family protein [Candidatus Poriferisocius sp.]|uniref:aldehyde dehydrogenase family protein n=1 Tax=Candidatus Poriferisocius sp. TaxID=3101276 RepID=UPI003B5CC024
MTFEVQNRIGDARQPASDGATLQRHDPADARTLVSVAPESTGDDVGAAVAAAAQAFPEWSRTTPSARAALLEKAAGVLAAASDEIGAEMVAEMGKPLGMARKEAARTPKNLELYAAEAIRLTGVTYPSDDPGATVYSEREPVGVVGVITPWNFPLNLASRKIGPALAAGNTVVFKPSPMTPRMGERLGEAFVEAGFPPGVVNTVHGVAAGAHLVADERVGAITFTGSTATGARIHDAVGLGRRLQLELGGNNPIVVLADADLDAAAQVVAQSSFSLSGQACTAAGRILVATEVHDALLDLVVAKAAAHVVGRGTEASTTMGPLIDGRAVEAMAEVVADAVAAGARVVTGGSRLEGDLAHGHFFAPTLLADVDPTMALARTEVFGPVVGFERVSGLEEAVERANAGDYGLTSAICTTSIAAARRFAMAIQAGTVRINRPTVGAAFNAPFGGTKRSGTGTHREQLGPTVMDFYTSLKTVFFGS